MNPLPRYNKLSSHLRELFGCRVHRVAVDAGFTCPNRDGTLGTGGCIYCEGSGARAAYVEPSLPIREQVRRGIEQLRRRYKAEKFLVYFQPFTNTYAPVERLRALYGEALEHPDVVGLMIGTRADALSGTGWQPVPNNVPSPAALASDQQNAVEPAGTGSQPLPGIPALPANPGPFQRVAVEPTGTGCQPVLHLLEEYHRRTYLWVELGLQSVNDETLRWIGRGHDFAAFERAAAEAKARGLRLCAHLIVGLPTDRRENHLAAADALNRLGFDGVKIHCLYVSRNAPLGAVFAREPFPLLTRREYIERVCDILERLDPRIVIHRLTSDAGRAALLAPDWCLDKQGVAADIEAELERRSSRQGSKSRL